MMTRHPVSALIALLWTAAFVCAAAGLPAMPGDTVSSTLAAPRPDEPYRAFDRKQAVAYLDRSSEGWRGYRNCTSCHSTFAYLMARSGERAGGTPDVMKQTLAQVEKRVAQGDQIAPWYPGERDESSRQTEAVMNALALALYDHNTQSGFRPITRKALDQVWAVRGRQWKQGAWRPGNASPVWNWLDFGLGTWESKQEAPAGAALALLATGLAPAEYRQKPDVQSGVAAVREYLKLHPSPLLHHRLLLLWADSVQTGLLTAEEKAGLVEQTRRLQNPDGGWSTPRLYTAQSDPPAAESDGYGTGFTLLMLRKAGVSVQDSAIRRGITWLREHQRQSGAWQTLTVNPGLHNASAPVPARFPTHLGTAFALMALQACY